MARKVILAITLLSSLASTPYGWGATPDPATPSSVRTAKMAERERKVARIRRFLLRAAEELAVSKRVAEEDIAELDGQIDAVTPTEPMQREADLLSMLDTHYGYLDWVKDRSEELEDDLEQLSPDSIPGGDFLENSFADMGAMLGELVKVVDEKAERFRSEEKGLVETLERKRELQVRIEALQSGLAAVRQKGSEGAGRHTEEESAELRIMAELEILQGDLISLPEADEEMLGHYALLTAWGESESERLALQRDEFLALSRVAALLPRDTARSAGELERAFQQAIRDNEQEIALIERKRENVEKMRSSLTLEGTLREVDRSRDLADLYDRLQQRYKDLAARLRIAIGAWQAEISEVRSAAR